MPGKAWMDATELVACMLANRMNAEILARLPRLGLPQCMLTAGCLFQTIWNAACDRPAEAGIRDYDVFYFDDRDLSWEAEDRVIAAARTLFADLGVVVELRNQARVHLWYEARFGVPSPPLSSSRDSIDRYLVRCTCVGIETATGTLYAPCGLDELQAGILRLNPRTTQPALFRRKAEDYRARWPFLAIAG